MISKKLFGTLPDKREVDIYELKNSNGVSASVITYGATWQSLFAPDRDGNFEDVLIGFDDLESRGREPCSRIYEPRGLKRLPRRDERKGDLHSR